ncbi:unnamed protein product [Closterium sp. Naga37s-1]|nr:unnamed protein product [Closterium sp. Naga37s-1]
MRAVRDNNLTGNFGSAYSEAESALATATSYLSDHPTRRKTQEDTFTPGSCSDYEGAAYIKVYTADDIARRLNYPRKRTVILELNKNLVLDKGLLFDSRYSCTVLRSNNITGSGFKISYFGADQPVLRIWNTSNVLVLGVSFSLGVRTSSPQCVGVPENGVGVNCPTIHVYRSYGIQIAKGTVFGRIDLFRSMSSRVDSMRVTGVPVFNKSPGVIRVAMSGHGPTLEKSYIAVTNNEVYGVDTPIVLYQGAIGVIVRNNYVHDFIFAGIRCGADVHYAADCVLATISYNIVVAAGTNRSGDQDAAGIYFCTHLFSPANLAECNCVSDGVATNATTWPGLCHTRLCGPPAAVDSTPFNLAANLAECNYVFNGDHCYYLDYVLLGLLTCFPCMLPSCHCLSRCSEPGGVQLRVQRRPSVLLTCSPCMLPSPTACPDAANLAECNYVFNGDHCYYLDYVTSGVTVNGGACVGTYDGIKVNNGKW